MLFIPFHIYSVTRFGPVPSPSLKNVLQSASPSQWQLSPCLPLPITGGWQEATAGSQGLYFLGLPLHCPILVFIHSPIHDGELNLTQEINLRYYYLLDEGHTDLCLQGCEDRQSALHMQPPAKVSSGVKTVQGQNLVPANTCSRKARQNITL